MYEAEALSREEEREGEGEVISHRPTGSEENKKAKVKDPLKWGMTDLEVSLAIQSDSIDQIKHECANNFLLPSWKLEDHFISINLKKNIIISC
jgi:hypothetical protein